MKISTFKQHLQNISELKFTLPNNHSVEPHFHITEAGLVTKHFVDCGGTIRMEKSVTFQMWVAEDTDHRLSPQKLLNIIAIAEPLFGSEDLEVEVEYQMDTIGKFGVEVKDGELFLTNKFTDCLAKDKCGIPAEKPKLQLVDLTNDNSSCCTPGSGCC